MKNFFSTLFKLNAANVAKIVCGIAVGVMAASTAGVVLPAVVIGTATGIISVGTVLGVISGVGTTLGIHATHLATPPGKIAIPEGAIDPSAPIN